MDGTLSMRWTVRDKLSDRKDKLTPQSIKLQHFYDVYRWIGVKVFWKMSDIDIRADSPFHI